MQNNIFKFGNTYWRQKIGAAMGTSLAVQYANTYVAILELEIIIPTFKQNLPLYGRFIDD